MRKISRFRDIVTLLSFILLLALVVAKVEQDKTLRIDGVFQATDGDSIRQGAKRLRLQGIDAPEFSQTCVRDGKPWDCGQQSRRALSVLLGRCGSVCEGSERDRYGRLLVTCRNGKLDINGEQVRQGLAVAFGAYEREQQEARTAKRGLWAGEFLSPSEWRARHRPDAGREEPHSSTFF